MAKFFIDRPVFAWVVALVIMLAGGLSILQLPIEQYPSIAPPSVQIEATYPGASAETVENTVTQVIEQEMNGLDYLRYMSSNSSATGSASITLTFEPEADPDIAQVQVQNKLQAAMSRLPSEVQQQGITVSKSSGSFLMVAGFVSADGSMNAEDLSDFVVSTIEDPIARVNGVGSVQVFGAQHAMRIWLDPNKLISYNLTVSDVSSAIEAQNTEVTAGQIGGAPSVPGQQINATITAQSKLTTVDEFANILLRVNTDGSQVRLGDVARIEIGGESYEVVARYNAQAATGIGINLATGANALDTAEAVKARLEELKPFFPQGMEVVYPYDTTPFVKVSIEEVVRTLFEAIALVFVVMFVFLQNWRATLIPTIAVPVVLLGTFGVLAAFGYSINTLTMFGMVLAIGLLVDDAIVVVENVERVMHEDGLPPREATRKSMSQITGALVGIALVLSAVFVPMAFFAGSTGAIYRQFSITIVSAMVLSVIVAIVLTPALCATMLKPSKGDPHAKKGFFGWFNRGFDKTNNFYQGSVGHVVNRKWRYLFVYGILVGALAFLFVRLPGSFLPEEDQGIMFSMVQLPAGASQERTVEVLKKLEKHFMEDEKEVVNGIFTVAGFSFAGSGQNAGIAFVNLKDWSERTSPGQSVEAVIGRAYGAFAQIREAMVFAFAPPAIIELGTANGFDMQLVDRGGAGHDALIAARNQLLGMASQDPRLVGVRPNGLNDTPQFDINIDQEKASALGVSIADINRTLATAWGSSYVNDFIEKGRVKRVYMQADAKYRMMPEDMDHWYVRNSHDEMVPISAFSTTQWTYGSPRLERFNGLSSVNIQGQAAPGVASGDAMTAMQEIVAKLPGGIGLEWQGLSYEEREAGEQGPALYALSMIVVFLCLAALYESWAIPVSVMMVVPLGVLGAVIAALLRGLPDDVYFQVAILTTIGLSAKNAILIVEFARELYDQGMGLLEATVEAARQRLRPIIMTSMAFTLGVLPLAISTGAGAGARIAVGTGVMGGMIAATILAIFFVPLFFVLIVGTFAKSRSKRGDVKAAHEHPAE
ncbi:MULTISPECIES: efflux RND transporter permease subunit [Thalassospira]|jgi:hydrophobe/amphiphile efflux-1 (HAE1) family protein|uniref:Efflux pump membrane transporter n=1 Tax=Thalassospira xiamenensis TaxID=220697 RepID=A0ABR5Y736_9PROT|nr:MULTISPECIES: efflux RND transporter permease subunit [Thalassospira]MAL30321.1 hydrophobe/amphiphile efflux-1 family RND transporter [Thalassospira sp.]MBR9779175.1 efflux RND transporter permease subunit [Rhodospirillales bacterium]KZD07050.1 multidrug transporter [Thalassospira xiamenensis]KZD08879.1 multidrug transporter [Thalassospira xiamenensis]MBL4840926.1 efflux RND transporter permease subunit [Thalassospira sp.]|tara:strand:+ start:30357 stop:33503 length:3147 start_codon:yes stop_codon:yes gene_type:complete